MSDKYVSFEDKPMDAVTRGGNGEPYYPSLSVPLDVFESDPSIGDKLYMSVLVEVESLDKRGARVKVLKGCDEGEVSDDELEGMEPEDADKEVEKAFNKNKEKDDADTSETIESKGY